MTSIWPVKSRVRKVIDYARNPEKTKETSYEKLTEFHTVGGVLEYAANEMKTEERSYVTCIGCREDTAAEQFMETKKIWSRVSGMDKTRGRICYHGYQSFADKEVTAETAHEIGVKLAERLWGDRFEVLIATHCNTGHYHNHFVINSVSHIDGLKFYNSRKDYRLMRRESDRLCREYGISVIEEPKRRGLHYSEYLAEANGKPTLRGFIRTDIDDVIQSSLTGRDFFGGLMAKGYQLKLHNEKGRPLKYPALKPAGAKGYFRFHNLGEGYSLEEIEERILRNRRRRLPFSEEELEEAKTFRREHPPKTKLHGLKALYYRYCYELQIIRRFPASAARVPFSMKEDVTRMERISKAAQLLADKDIDTMEDLARCQMESSERLNELENQRRSLRNSLKRTLRRGDEEEAQRIRAVISSVSKEMAEIRRSLDLMEEIRIRSEGVSEAVGSIVSTKKTTEETEVKQDEYLLGGRS